MNKAFSTQVYLFAPVLLLSTAVILRLGNLDEPLFLLMQQSLSFGADNFWAAATLFGDSFTVAILLFPLIRRYPEIVLHALIAAIIATVFTHLLKPYFDSPRPAAVLQEQAIQIIGPVLRHKSFPSGHAATIFTLFGILALHLKMQWRLLLLLFAVVVSVSRVMVGAHWPSDILGGAAFGLLSVFAAAFLIGRFRWKFNHTVQIIFGALLMAAAVHFTFIYNTRLPQVVAVQLLYGTAVILIGIYQYSALLRKR